jgi:rhodanese-related sulfurtransferase
MRKHCRPYIVVVLITLSIFSTVGAHDEKQLSAAVKLMTVEELKTRVSANEPLVILDVRNSESYASSDAKIKGAIHVSVRKLRYRLGFPPLKDVPKDRQVVTYCSCPSDEASIKAAQVLMDSGFTNVRVLKGGWLEWQKASGPIEARARG